MSGRHQQTVLKRVRLLGIANLIIWGLVGLAALMAPSSGAANHARFGALVFPNFDTSRQWIDSVTFDLADESYTLKRSSDGWVMPEVGDYPVRRDRIAELATGLESLVFDIERTNRPDRHRFIGLANPAADGNGVALQVNFSDGRAPLQAILGRTERGLYYRAPDEAQTYRLDGSLPPFYTRRAWLDFEILTVDPDAIGLAKLTDADGVSLELERRTGDSERAFVPIGNYATLGVRNPFALSNVALAISRLSVLEVKPSRDLATSPIMQHDTVTFDGLEIKAFAFSEDDGHWLTLEASELGEGRRRAASINDMARGWAFRISEIDFRDYTAPISSLIATPAPPLLTETGPTED